MFSSKDASVYSSVTNTYNARDQLTEVRQYAGPVGSASQVTTMDYDGYGRLKTKHVPEQDAGTATPWDYNPDDTVQKVTDARGSVSNFSYNSRHLVTGVTYDPSSGITDTPDVSFGYDWAGNRTSMSDGQGGTTYVYDQLSRLTSETRTLPVGSFTIGYGYNLANQLTSLTEPTQFGSTFSYAYDSAGKLTAVNGSAFAGVTNYASNAQYRAWGALKHLTYGNSKTLDATYTARLQPASFNIPGVSVKSYDYYADGALRFSSDAINHKFDRFYSYDQAARIKDAFSGAEARFEPLTDDRPYRQTFAYDAIGHLTSRTSNIWRDAYSTSDTYVNNRSTGWSYDAAGNLLSGSDNAYTYDAAGQINTVSTLYNPASSTTRWLDGQGQQVKTVETTFNEQTQTDGVTTKYYLRSTVLGGQVLTEVSELSTKVRTFVYAGGSVLAWQMGQSFGQRVMWEHRDPSGASFRTTDTSGNPGGLFPEEASAELDPTGANAGTHAPLFEPGPPPDETGGGSLGEYPSFSNPRRPGTTYAVDHIPVSVDYFMMQLSISNHGSFTGSTLRSDTSSRRWVHTGWLMTSSPSTAPRPPGPNISLGHIEIVELGYWQSTLAASWSWLIQSAPSQTQSPAPDVAALRGRIMNILKNSKGRCAEFIASLINGTSTGKNAPEFTSILDGFDLVKKNFVYGNTIKDFYKLPGATARGSVSRGDAQVELPYPWAGNNPTNNQAIAASQNRLEALEVMHELIHLAGKRGYDDLQLARTAAAMQGKGPADYSALSPRQAAVQASYDWHAALSLACKARR